VFSSRKKKLGVTSDVSEECQEKFSDINKKNKLQNPSGNYETNLMILINLSLVHVGIVALKAFHGLIRLKRFVSLFLRKLCN
jgi:hypothetical protein